MRKIWVQKTTEKFQEIRQKSGNIRKIKREIGKTSLIIKYVFFNIFKIYAGRIH